MSMQFGKSHLFLAWYILGDFYFSLCMLEEKSYEAEGLQIASKVHIIEDPVSKRPIPVRDSIYRRTSATQEARIERITPWQQIGTRFLPQCLREIIQPVWRYLKSIIYPPDVGAQQLAKQHQAEIKSMRIERDGILKEIGLLKWNEFPEILEFKSGLEKLYSFLKLPMEQHIFDVKGKGFQMTSLFSRPEAHEERSFRLVNKKTLGGGRKGKKRTRDGNLKVGSPPVAELRGDELGHVKHLIWEELVQTWDSLQEKLNEWRLNHQHPPNLNDDQNRKLYEVYLAKLQSQKCLLSMGNFVHQFNLIPAAYMERIELYQPVTIIKMFQFHVQTVMHTSKLWMEVIIRYNNTMQTLRDLQYYLDWQPFQKSIAVLPKKYWRYFVVVLLRECARDREHQPAINCARFDEISKRFVDFDSLVAAQSSTESKARLEAMTADDLPSIRGITATFNCSACIEDDLCMSTLHVNRIISQCVFDFVNFLIHLELEKAIKL
ncbi:hypothetical protein PGT21_011783 [Puccinia graminis f. sp. tritici]|uniref:Uncharacterized protein n=1 Tax=Puccinia graminis f. sp. tritici TaxID=56615 RepID=A0A5B0M0X6_PUCGR|nr:hypothetical protein PGT21_011783 [Puccinia graminis f. sp. tritici]KAA1089982.1 hypothetical protein PGTUg99_032346 [Puccinia graminis f. sp. tritici]